MRIRSALQVLLLLSATALGAAPAAAQNMTGEWQVMSRGPDGTVTRTLAVEQEGSTLTGTISGVDGGESVEISNGTVEGASFSFTAMLDGGGSVTFTGTYEGDFMEGTFAGAGGGGQAFMGTRGD